MRPGAPFLPTDTDESRRGADYRRRWAVVVGVRDYGDAEVTGLRSLPNAVNDACAVHRLLVESYGFESTLLCHEDDLVRIGAAGSVGRVLHSDGLGMAGEIVDAVHAVRKRAEPHDFFAFFYAGHGSGDGGGFLVPFGGIRDRGETHLTYNELFGEVRALPCLHKLLLFDCCFAGVVHRGETVVDAGPLIWLEREAVIAATSSIDVALDAYTDPGGLGAHSPFTEALLETLDGLPAGNALRPSGLYECVRRGVARRVETLRSGLLEPTLSIRGEGIMMLARPGMRIEQARVLRVAQKEHARRERLVASGGTPPLDWSVAPEVHGVSVVGDELHVDGAKLGPGRFELTLSVKDAGRRVTQSALTLLVTTSSQTPPEIVTAALPPCIVGRLYRTRIEVEGGSPPLRWTPVHLPSGLSLDEHGQVLGLLRSADRAAEIVHFRVVDDHGREATAEYRLLTIDPDVFCDVPSGPARVGYQPDQRTAVALFKAGLNAARVERLAESFPAGEVFVPRFFIKKFPVTRGEWRRFLTASRHVSTPNWLCAEHDHDLPATGLSRGDIEAFLAWRRSRLPSRLEWEKAARGADARPFPWGIEFDRHAANHAGLSWADLTPVDQFPHGASPFGVQDLAGNCWELVRQFGYRHGAWCQYVRGGSMNSDVSQLLTFTATELEGDLCIDPVSGELHADVAAIYPNVGFREVVEVIDSPPYPQGLISVGRSDFELGSGEKVRTHAFLLARYCVSNAEYSEFVAATGEPRPPHWSKTGRPFRFEARHLPVVNVTHEDAKSFCVWKSERLGTPVQLPSHAQWQSAAYGPGRAIDGFEIRSHPWGSTFDASRCNSAESGSGQAVRVFDQPEGRAPCGAFHLVGNTFEWVAPDLAVGGSWATPCADPLARRVAGVPRRFDIGFRYCSSRMPRPEERS